MDAFVRKALRATTHPRGWRKIASWLYWNKVRPQFPVRVGEFNGVAVPAKRLSDSFLPWVKISDPNYESGLCELIDTRVSSGDDVVVVGGGWGVTAVKAARAVGSDGSVVVFEGGVDEVEQVAQTCVLNNVADQVEIRHAIVGDEIALRSSGENAELVEPGELPECNILQLDCEGAELKILEEMEIRPRELFVESHGFLGADTESVRKVLTELGYSVASSMVADVRMAETCKEQDIHVLHAVGESST